MKKKKKKKNHAILLTLFLPILLKLHIFFICIIVIAAVFQQMKLIILDTINYLLFTKTLFSLIFVDFTACEFNILAKHLFIYNLHKKMLCITNFNIRKQINDKKITK